MAPCAAKAAPAVGTATGLLNFAVRNEFLGWFYTVALLMADIQMTVSLHYICLARCQCFEDIYIATDRDLNQWAYDNAPALYDDPLLEKPSVPLSASEDLASKKRDAKRRYVGVNYLLVVCW